MQLELLLTNEARVLPSVDAFARETLRQLPLSTSDAAWLEGLVLSAVRDAVEHAYPVGEEGSIKLSIRERHGKLEIQVRDFGIPQDVKRLEQRAHAGGKAAARLFGCSTDGLVDEVHWLGYGPQGKALQLIKWLSNTKITDDDSATLEPFRDDVPPAPPQEYTVRRMLPEEAVQVSQLMYRSYGNTYFNPDVYYPDRVAAQNAHGAILSFVARAADGSIAGHYALELNQEGPVAETGQAVVDPAHRGRGLLKQMQAAALEEARRRDLLGWYGDAVAVHTLTQKSNVSSGGHLCGVDLAISPATEVFRGIGGPQPQRVTCLMYFHWLSPPKTRTVHVPARHAAMTATIYENLQCPIRLGTASPAVGHGVLAVKMLAAAGRGNIRAELLGADSLAEIRHAKRDLVERSGAHVVFVDLPLEDPATPQLAEELEGEGLAFAGIAPEFSTRGDLLRLAYLVEPLQREPIKTFEPLGNELVNYCLAEQARVREE